MRLRISASVEITKKVRIVFLARETPTGSRLHPYQILSNYIKQYESYGLHKISASREITTLRRYSELSVLHATCLVVFLLIPTKYYQKHV